MSRSDSKQRHQHRIDTPITLDCKLFSDRVSEELCLLRRKELHLKGTFSCEGCCMDEIVSEQMLLMKEVLGMGR